MEMKDKEEVTEGAGKLGNVVTGRGTEWNKARIQVKVLKRTAFATLMNCKT
jgi:hypothetical protein